MINRHCRKWMAILAVLTPLAAAASTGQAEARIVGVVYDDSNSMEGYGNFPALLLRTLTVTLRPDDTLLAVRMSDFSARYDKGVPFEKYLDPAGRGLAEDRDLIKELSLAGGRRDVAATIAAWGRAEAASGRTPLGALALMLAELLERGERTQSPVTLIVFTDGHFSVKGLDQAAGEHLFGKFEKRHPGAQIHTFFVSFARESKGLQRIREQGIGRALEATFDPGGVSKTFEALGFDEIRRALTEVMAAVNDTAATSAAVGGAARLDGPTLTIEPPFAVRRILFADIAPASAGAPAVVVRTTPARTRVDAYTLEMPEADEYKFRLNGRAVGSEIWTAAVTEMTAEPAIRGGEVFTATLNRSAHNPIVLFDSNISLETRITEAPAGPEIRPDSRGVILLELGRDYRIETRVHDHSGGSARPQEADLSALPPGTRIVVNGLSGGPVPMAVEQSAPTLATAPLVADRPFRGAIQVVLNMPGFVVQTSNRIRFEALRSNTTITMSAEADPGCPRCTGGVIRPALLRDSDWVASASVDLAISASADGDGVLTIGFGGATLPAGIRFVDRGGRTLAGAGDSSFTLPFVMPRGAGRAEHGLGVQVDGRLLTAVDSAGGAGQRLTLHATSAAPFIGSGSLDLVLAPGRPDATLAVKAITGPDGNATAGRETLTLHPVELDGVASFLIRVDDADGPMTAADVRVLPGRFGGRVSPGPTPGQVTVTPTRGRWQPFACCVPSGDHVLGIAFRNEVGQEAGRNLSLTIEQIGWRGRLELCLPVALGTIGFVWFGASIRNLVASSRFPHRSRLLIYPDGQRQQALRERLRRGVWGYLVKAVVWPWSRADQIRSVRGLKLKAAPDGVLLLRGSYDTLSRNHEHRLLSSYFETGGVPAVELSWGDRLRRRDESGEILELIETTLDA